jgi:4-aminobutyrate aminotransferase
MTFAKGLGNGFAIGGVIARGDVMDSLSANSISTFGGNPISTAAANATLDYVLEHDLQANALKLGNKLMNGLRHIGDENPVIGDVRGKGLMIGIELVEPGGDTPSTRAAARMMEETRKRGLLIGKGGLNGNVLRLAPPMTLTEPEADEALRILEESIVVTNEELTR